MSEDFSFVREYRKRKLIEKTQAEACKDIQISIERVIIRPHGNKNISPEKLKMGETKNKVAVKLNKNTTIYVDPEKVEQAKERWLENYNKFQAKDYRRGINVSNNR